MTLEEMQSLINEYIKGINIRLEKLSGCHEPLKSGDECICIYCLDKRIEKLEGITDFKKLEECIFNGAQTHLSILKCESEIKKLESNQLDPQICNIISERLDRLEKEINSHWHLLSDLSPKLDPKKPYKCPVCDGEGKSKFRLISQTSNDEGTIKALVPDDCHACKGKGIIWG
jgi:hypothetical protein